MSTKTLQMIVRVFGTIQLILGGIVWSGKADNLIIFHIISGSILTLALFLLIYRAYRAGVSKTLVAIAAIWALSLPIWGITQEKIFPEAYAWIAQVIHLLCGVGIVGLAEVLAGKMAKKS